MRQESINIYEFDELSDDAKQTVLENLADINVDHEWYDFIYDDAEMIGLEITGFSIQSHCNINPVLDHLDISYAILKNHGKKCETHKVAQKFLNDRDKLVEKYSDGISTNKVAEDNEYDFDQECDKLENDFILSLSEDFRIMLRESYEYLTSEQAILETIDANEYEFTLDGNIY